MIVRVTSEIWVGAHVRRCNASGAMALVARKGAHSAGAIFLKINRLDRTFDLYGPAPQTIFEDDHPVDRRFERVLDAVDEHLVDERLAKEARFDPDFWVIEIEDRQGRAFLDD